MLIVEWRWPTMRSALQHNVKFLLTLLVFSSLAWAADVPWKGKPYDQWDDKDVQKVFTDSPWARTATLTRTWVPLTGKDSPNAPMDGSDRTIPRAMAQSSEAIARGIVLSLPSIGAFGERSEEHTSELQSLTNLVCRLLTEKKDIQADVSA